MGLAGAGAAAYALRSLLFHVSSTDPRAYVVAAVLLTTVAVIAAVLPSRRAAGLDPARTLRYE